MQLLPWHLEKSPATYPVYHRGDSLCSSVCTKKILHVSSADILLP